MACEVCYPLHPSKTAVLVLTAILACEVLGQSCPSRCRPCTGNVVNCYNKGLTTPPRAFPPNTRVIDLRSNNIRLLGVRTFRPGQTAEVLKLSANRIRVVRPDAFRSFPNLMSLDLTGNRITRIFQVRLSRLPRNSRLPRLRTLNLNRNRIRNITGIFWGVPNLRQLNLAKNRIEILRQGDLDPLTGVHYLDLRDNKITSIHGRAFQLLQRLRYLFLNDNPIAQSLDISFGSMVLQLVDFSNCQLPTVPQVLPSSVNDLRLGGNQIMQINHTDFETMTNLQMLGLNDNQLHFLADGTFTHLAQLKEIWMRGNNLVYIPRGIPPNVEKIHMDSNRIQEIESGIFSNSEDSNLTFFTVENNKLRRINRDTFAELNNLQTINLQGNQLQMLEASSFRDLPQLQTLKLSNNPLQRMDANVFQNLPNLKELYLSYLEPESMELEGNFLPAMSNLQGLHIMGSPGMAQALVHLVDGLSNSDAQPFLQMLDLSFNSLQWISPRLQYVFPNVKSVLLEGNPFHCSEELVWLKQWMTNAHVKFSQYEEPACQSPELLKGVPVSDF